MSRTSQMRGIGGEVSEEQGLQVPLVDTRQVAPVPEKRRSLDMGCGDAPELLPAEVQVGLDISLPALQQVRKRFPHAHFVCGDGECLPFRGGAFDAVISRVALPLMNLNAAIPELSRVLKPEGRATLSFHHCGFAWRDLLRRIRSGHLRAMIGGVWALVNGCLFHLFGRTLRLPFSGRFYDSFQTFSRMERFLRANGFSGRIWDRYLISAHRSAEVNEKSCSGEAPSTCQFRQSGSFRGTLVSK